MEQQATLTEQQTFMDGQTMIFSPTKNALLNVFTDTSTTT